MSAAVVTLEQWSAGFHSTMAAAAKASIAIKRQATFLSIAKDFWDLSKTFKEFIRSLDPPSGFTIASEEEDQFRVIIQGLRSVHTKTVDLLGLAARKGLSNRTFVSASISTVRKLNDEVLDIIESFELSLDASTSEAIAQAQAEQKRGETVDYRSVL